MKSAQGFTGFTGAFRFLDNGENQRNLSIVEASGGAFKEVGPAKADFVDG
jgi:hypothetical protein